MMSARQVPAPFSQNDQTVASCIGAYVSSVEYDHGGDAEKIIISLGYWVLGIIGYNQVCKSGIVFDNED